MGRHVSNDQDWEQVDDEDCWGVDYTEPTAQIREKIETGPVALGHFGPHTSVSAVAVAQFAAKAGAGAGG